MELRLEGVRVRLSNQDVLRGCDAEIRTGVTGLVGRNGAGKTTLIRLMAGAVAPNGGRVVRDGDDIRGGPAELRRHRRRLGWLPQEPQLPPRLRVDEFVAYASWLKEIPRSERPAAVDAALAQADLLDLRRQRLGRLSGGQRRRAALAAAVVGSPSLILLDEPTNGLDPVQRVHFLSRIRVLAENRAVVLATHVFDDLAQAADQWIALDAGRVIGVGSMDRSSEAAIAASLADLRSALSAVPAND